MGPADTRVRSQQDRVLVLKDHPLRPLLGAHDQAVGHQGAGLAAQPRLQRTHKPSLLLVSARQPKKPLQLGRKEVVPLGLALERRLEVLHHQVVVQRLQPVQDGLLLL